MMQAYLRLLSTESNQRIFFAAKRLLAQGFPSLGPEIDFEKFEQLRSSRLSSGNAGSIVLVDVRNRVELDDAGSIPGAINVPLDELSDALSMGGERFKEAYGAAKPSTSDAIVFFCKVGVRSEQARVLAAKSFGFINASNYRGSYSEWSARINRGRKC